MIPLERFGSLFSRAYLLVPGVYAWLATVASPTLGKDAPTSARYTAFAALVALVLGPYVAVERPRLGRIVGVFLFVALCLGTWLLLGSMLSVDRLEPVQAALGGFGWAAFAFGWGSLRQLRAVPEEHPNVLRGSPLRARDELPRGAIFVLAVSVVGAMVCLATAWRVARPDHALLAHAAAIACAIAVLGVGSRVAILRGGTRQPHRPASRVAAAGRTLMVLGVALVAGLFWLALR